MAMNQKNDVGLQKKSDFYQKRKEGWIFYLYGKQKPLCGLNPIFGGRGPRRNYAIQIWRRSVQAFLVGWGSKFAFFP